MPHAQTDFSQTKVAGVVVRSRDGVLHTLREEIPRPNRFNSPLQPNATYGVFDLITGEYFGYYKAFRRTSTTLKAIVTGRPYGLRPLNN